MLVIGNNPKITRQTNLIASGTLSDGTPVVVNVDGTVSSVAQTTINASSGNPQTADTNGAAIEYAACYDSTNDKVVCFYNRLNDLVGVVGTVNGTTITFGTPVTISTSTTGDHNALFIPSTSTTGPNKVVWIGKVGSNTGSYCVCEVNGTSLTYGSVGTWNTGARSIKAAYDSTNDRIVVAYRDTAVANYPKVLMLLLQVGTSSIGTPGSPDNVASSTITDDGQISLAYSSHNSKFLITYPASNQIKSNILFISNAGSGTFTINGQVTVSTDAITGPNYGNIVYDPDQQVMVVVYRTSSGGGFVKATGTDSSTPAYGSGQTIHASMLTANAVYDSAAKKVVVFYTRDNGYGLYKDITANGTTLTVGAEQTVLAQSVSGSNLFGLVHDTEQNTNVAFFRRVGDSNHAAGVCFQLQHTVTNVTTGNYIGFPISGGLNGQSITVKTQGEIATNVTGLTAGQVYYVQNDGSLSTTASTPSVLAGTAISSTELIVKG
tara:strand:- start:8022 stop:9497 length:1476 start_codon:yes stop_codon:yes gene_type:complete